MKTIQLITACLASATLLVSCGATSTMQKDIKYMQIRFKPLTRADITLIGNLQVETTISGRIGKNGKTLDANFMNNLKEGKINKTEATEVMYFAPNAGEAITGSLYENEVFNSVYGSANQSGKPKGFLAKLFPSLVTLKKLAPADHGMQFAYFAMIEKYPEVDYFINVRFDRKTILKGKKYVETVIVKADGVKLKTD